MRDLRALPKAELHIHMEGAMRVATVLELVERNGVPAPSGLTETGWRFERTPTTSSRSTSPCAA